MKAQTWIDHLAFCASGGWQTGETSRLLCADQSWGLDPVAAETALDLLADYCAIYRDGMRRPLPFFPDSSYTWASSEDPDQARGRIEKIWSGPRPGSDAGDPYLQLALRGIAVAPADNHAFTHLAQRVYTGLLAQAEKL